jgi:hypothetical protein
MYLEKIEEQVNVLRKAHIALLIVTAILALSSAYSLAAMNQVFKVDMEWFSEREGQYLPERRDTSGDRCSLDNDRLNLEFFLADNREILSAHEGSSRFDTRALPLKGWYDNFYIYCSLGKVNSPEYRIKITDIAQRGNNVEVKVSINTPAELESSVQQTWKTEQTVEQEVFYYPQDIIRIKKGAFPAAGRLYFTFKNQDGELLYEQYFDM